MTGVKPIQILLALFTLHFVIIWTCVDRNPHECQEKVKAHHCYIEHNRGQCCQTCEGLRTGDPECPYGDHLTTITKRFETQEAKYTCESYVSFFGRHYCTAEPKFREYCCQSCKTKP